MAKKVKTGDKNPRDLNPAEIEAELTDLNERVFRVKFQLAMGQTDAVKNLRVMKKRRARLLTARREREIAAEAAKK